MFFIGTPALSFVDSHALQELEDSAYSYIFFEHEHFEKEPPMGLLQKKEKRKKNTVLKGFPRTLAYILHTAE